MRDWTSSMFCSFCSRQLWVLASYWPFQIHDGNSELMLKYIGYSGFILRISFMYLFLCFVGWLVAWFGHCLPEPTLSEHLPRSRCAAIEVCVRFLCGETSMCFVNVHLPSGSGKVEDRNEHLHEILSYAFQGISRNGSSRQPKTIASAKCRVFFCFCVFFLIFCEFCWVLWCPRLFWVRKNVVSWKFELLTCLSQGSIYHCEI